MKNQEELKNKIKNILGEKYFVNVGQWGMKQIKISIRWDYIGFYEGNSMYSNNEFITINSDTFEIENVSDSTDSVLKKIIKCCL